MHRRSSDVTWYTFETCLRLTDDKYTCILISSGALFAQRNIDVLNHTNCCSKSNYAAFLRKVLISSACHLKVFSILDLIDVLFGNDLDMFSFRLAYALFRTL